MSADTLAGLYEQCARRRCGQAAGALLQALADPGQFSAVLGEMAFALEEAAAVISVVAGNDTALVDVREELAGEAAGLIALAGRLEQAADLGRR